MSKKKKSNKPRTLSELVSGNDLDNFNAALREEADSPCVLVCTNFLDEALAMLLMTTFANDTDAENLFDWRINGPLATFNVKIRVAYSLGLISKGLFDNLNAIRDIRNLFGHPRKSINFNTPDVSDICSVLKWHSRFSIEDEDLEKPRERFTQIVGEIYGTLIMCINTAKAIPKKTDEWDQSGGSPH